VERKNGVGGKRDGVRQIGGCDQVKPGVETAKIQIQGKTVRTLGFNRKKTKKIWGGIGVKKKGGF